MHCKTNTQDRVTVPNPICKIHQKLTSNQRKMPTRVKKNQILRKSGPVEPSVHPITTKAQHKVRNCARAILLLLNSF